jgi:hypothetical protein
MMKRIFIVSLSLFFIGKAAPAQEIKRQKLAIFTPLYLDSAFDIAGNFRYEKVGAKFSNPGLDFYYGAQLALDSLQKRGAPLEVFFLDSRSKQTIPQQLAKPELKDVEMLLAQSNVAETQALSEEALRKKIPFISATLPNDAGVSNNPYLVVLNSTLQAHVESIYRYLQKYHSLDKIVVFRRSGGQEEQLKNYFTGFAKSTLSTPLSIKFVDIGTTFTPQTIAANLDSTRKTICIAGSLDEAFGLKLNAALSSLNKTYPVTVIGMPTWDNFNISKFSDLEIIYTTPFFYNRSSSLENQLASEYSKEMSNKPSDLFFRGYETVLRFGLLLLDTKKDVSSNLTRKGNTVLTQLDIQPVFKDRSAMILDYFENKHLYFIKVFGGVKNIVQ